MKLTKEIDHLLPDLVHQSAELAMEGLPIDQLVRCESPIEKLFLCALWSRGCWVGRLKLSLAPHFDGLCMDARESLLAVAAPQIQIGPYRVDFLLAMYCSATEPLSLVAVECDGHDFHEKTKHQAARDKRRDRDLQMRGVQVFRYTGAEIWHDAGGCASEVLLHLYSDWSDKSYRHHVRRVKEFGSLSRYMEHIAAGGEH